MLKALIFKEWLKIRWAGLTMLAVFFLAAAKTALNMSYGIRILGANNFWGEIILKNIPFFNDYLYLPVLTGIVIGVAQFFPEITDNRLKLTLHLPLKENNILLYMTFLGAFAVLSISAISLFIMGLITITYFPAEMLNAMLQTSYPWVLAGLVGYFGTITVFVEPIWFKRIFFILIFISYIQALLEPNNLNYFQHAFPQFTIVTLFFSIAILFSGHRFRKGVLK